MRPCEGKCGKSYEDHDQEPPKGPGVTKFLCFGCSLSFQVWAVEHGLEDPYISTPFGNEGGA